MSLAAFLRKHRRNDSSLRTILEGGVHELDQRLNTDERHAPTHLPDQRDLIADAFDADERVWILFLDGGRYDIFDQLVGDYFSGDLQRAWNGDIGYTGDWFVRNVDGDYPDRGLFSWVPIRFQQIDYDGTDHFAVAPDIMESMGVEERLAALGYTDGEFGDEIGVSGRRVNAAVRQHRDDVRGGLVRYLKPHPPFNGLADVTSERTKTEKTRAALETGDLTYADLTDAYIDTYHTGLSWARDLAADLDGRVILTADHGECLTCGQLFHGRHLDKHDHLTTVPWFEVDR
jgi:hypothetical protein